MALLCKRRYEIREIVKVTKCACGIATLVNISIVSLADCTLAQSSIEPDNTLGSESSIVKQQSIQGIKSDRIEGGAIRGANLFHSFREFNIGERRGAYFINPTGVENIFSRVTGNNISQILGKLGVLGNANLFLLNPNGIIFGKNASLDLRGSFVATTANAIQFGDRGLFSATNPQSASNLLTINPSAFFFKRIQTAQIQNRGSLQVPNGQSLLLLGGNVTVDNGHLIAPGGRVEIGAVAGTGSVGLNANGSLSFPDTIQRADVVFNNQALANRSGIDVRFVNGGDIGVTANNISLFSGSQLRAGIAARSGSPQSQGGNISVNASGEIRMTGEDTRIANDVRENGIGKAGNIQVTARSLVVLDGAQLSASTFGVGDAGNVVIKADRVIFSGVRKDEFGVSDAFSRVERPARGNGGTVQIYTNILEITNGAALVTATDGIGDAGNVVIVARDRVSFKQWYFRALSSFWWCR